MTDTRKTPTGWTPLEWQRLTAIREKNNQERYEEDLKDAFKSWASKQTASPVKEKTVKDILDELQATLGGREGNYDHPAPNFARIAAYWNLWLESKLKSPITALDVACMMILMKLAREQFKHTWDNLIDAAGYAICAMRIAIREKMGK